MSSDCRSACSRWRAAPWLALVVAVASMAIPVREVSAQGLFDFLFGSPRQVERPPTSSPPIDAVRPPAAAAPSNSGSTGAFAYCVRLCDGRYFPLQRSSTTPEKLCGMLCPASQTKVLYGSEVEHASARDGSRYATLANAYVYRKKEVANCTCNGRDVFGLAPIDLASDPTLRPGDIVSRPDKHSSAPAASAPSARK